MNVFVTGTDGYLGSLVGPELMAHGHSVTGLDTGYYREGWLFTSASGQPKTVSRDLRTIQPADLEGFDAVVHMAELSNDPLSHFAPDITREINRGGSLRLAQAAKDAGVPRFVYTSSCSVYGKATQEEVDETSPVDPQTVYAECKVNVEHDVSALASGSFSPVFLRNATAFGASPRMRFDLVVNNLSGLAWTQKQIKLTSDGTPWRPLVHGLDIARAIRMALEAPATAIQGEVLNVGDSAHNYRVRDIAETVANVFPGCSLSVGQPNGDNRSYRVNFDKIRRVLPGFACDWSAESGARQLFDLFQRIQMRAEDFEAKPFTRLKQLEHLVSTGQIDSRFYWTPCWPEMPVVASAATLGRSATAAQAV
jgi:nucleoside-diphosphate-sugar epimerase